MAKRKGGGQAPVLAGESRVSGDGERIERILSERLDVDEAPAPMTADDWTYIRKQRTFRVLLGARHGKTVSNERLLAFLDAWEADLRRLSAIEGDAL